MGHGWIIERHIMLWVDFSAFFESVGSTTGLGQGRDGRGTISRRVDMRRDLSGICCLLFKALV